jgi:hypothetical protein
MALLKPAPKTSKKLTPEQHEKAYQIAKTVLLKRLERKGLLKMPSKMLH